MSKKVKTYEVEVDGRKARVTVPERDEMVATQRVAARTKARVTEPERHEMVAYSGEPEDILQDVLRDNLSPEAVAAIAAHLDRWPVADAKVAREVKWFRDLLVGMVECEYERMCKELGL